MYSVALGYATRQSGKTSSFSKGGLVHEKDPPLDVAGAVAHDAVHAGCDDHVDAVPRPRQYHDRRREGHVHPHRSRRHELGPAGYNVRWSRKRHHRRTCEQGGPDRPPRVPGHQDDIDGPGRQRPGHGRLLSPCLNARPRSYPSGPESPNGESGPLFYTLITIRYLTPLTS